MQFKNNKQRKHISIIFALAVQLDIVRFLITGHHTYGAILVATEVLSFVELLVRMVYLNLK